MSGTSSPLPSFTPRRELGRTGFVATRIGAGDLADRAVPLDTCVATLRRALDAGLNVVDTAPNYEDGYSEQIVGAALAGRRAGIFLIDKVDHIDRPVLPQVGASLERLALSSVDLFVFHQISTLEAWQRLVAPGGPWQELEACRAAGKCRFIGLSSHHPGVLRAALDRGGADVLMFPIGPFVDSRYTDEVLPLTRERGVGSVCFKTFGAGKLLGDSMGYGRPLAERPRGKLSSGGEDSATPLLPRLSVDDCIDYTLTLDPDVALLGMSFPNEQDAALHAASRSQPLTPPQLADIRARAALAVQDKGDCWWNPPSP
ncbi:MAG TPA: aldo/keto reductase [Polyangiaceae bacterium]|nr:aldo/keto reductase [Polyangiaceae bacterium]